MKRNQPREKDRERELERLDGGGGINDEGHRLPEVFHSVAVAGYSSPDCTCTAQKVSVNPSLAPQCLSINYSLAPQSVC